MARRNLEGAMAAELFLNDSLSGGGWTEQFSTAALREIVRPAHNRTPG